MKQLSVSQSWILGLLCTTLGALLVTVWSIGTRVERLVLLQALAEFEKFDLRVLLEEDGDGERYEEITEEIRGLPGVRSATWQMDIPQWPGPDTEPDGWEDLWRTRLPANAVVLFESDNLGKFDYWQTAGRIRSITGVVEVQTPYVEWNHVMSLRHYANTVGWLSRLIALIGGAVLVALLITLATLVGCWPHHISPERTRVAATVIGMLWGVVVAGWGGVLLTPAELPRPPLPAYLLSGLLGLVATNLLLPRGYQRVRRPSDRQSHRVEW